MLSRLLVLVGTLSLLALSGTAKEQVPLAQIPLPAIPLLGFGTWNLNRDNASDIVVKALEVGYRHLDCAAIYGNENGVGAGIAKGLKVADVKREDIWITSKLWNDHHSPELVSQALDKTLAELEVTYLDLYLMHWPVDSTNGHNSIKYVETWKVMTKLLDTGLVRHVGVSNFSPDQLHKIIAATPETIPFAHQMELHPYLQQREFVEWHTLHGIHVTAYSPFGNTNPTYTASRKGKTAAHVPALLANDVILDISKARSCTPAQVALQWGRSRGTSVIPKSAHTDRIKENYQSIECELEIEDIKRIESELPVKRFNNPSSSWGVDLYDGLQDAAAQRACSSWFGGVMTLLQGARSALIKALKLGGLTRYAEDL